MLHHSRINADILSMTNFLHVLAHSDRMFLLSLFSWLLFQFILLAFRHPPYSYRLYCWLFVTQLYSHTVYIVGFSSHSHTLIPFILLAFRHPAILSYRLYCWLFVTQPYSRTVYIVGFSSPSHTLIPFFVIGPMTFRRKHEEIF